MQPNNRGEQVVMDHILIATLQVERATRFRCNATCAATRRVLREKDAVVAIWSGDTVDVYALWGEGEHHRSVHVKRKDR